MRDRDAYIMLISSLPRSERLFRDKQPPLSRERLERRLGLLSDEDAQCLSSIENILSWSSHDLEETDVEAVRAAEYVLLRLRQPTLRAIVEERLEVRTILAALRHRHREDRIPERPWGVGPRVKYIEANWSDPTFRLAARHSWLREAAALIEAQDPLALERHILRTTFLQLHRHSAGHLFDFEAVVIYVLKWNIFDRWARSNVEAAARRFEELTEAALGAFDARQLEEAAA